MVILSYMASFLFFFLPLLLLFLCFSLRLALWTY